MSAAKKLTPDARAAQHLADRAVKKLAQEILSKLVRLRNKASLVAGDPTPGRNLTALRNTADEMIVLLRRLREKEGPA